MADSQEPTGGTEPVPRRARVLIADDHPLFRAGVRQRLAGFADAVDVVGEASDGQEAIDLACELQPDVVLMDIAMPNVNGIEATRRIKERQPHVGILILTVYDDSQYVTALVEAGAAGYLLKTVEADELSRAILSVSAGESVLSPSVARHVLSRFALKHGQGAAQVSHPLSTREKEVLRLAARGISNKQIARQLDLSIRTVHAHMSHIFAKLGVASRTEAVVRGLQNGWLDLDDLP
ncbi:MAG TPA: response regulator transcription factor [Thermoleophilia bacterium]|nr:response regulator transcription factor [Thermoleophilia bacterium]